ncbi:alpha/beta fold hydrolase [Achromobacter sp. GG226]|uniref:alpha/beta fold hydrolase n=1 Tax=Verticiella alkaliphila TaxID=2779529 RepID=UPI001C0D4ED4|nr:alpha/beta fold hydrolase [Verticiella sp. GG226]MBU4609268.1 alpha/beta fold hydrolase [Verticiella sp. GG226]
MSTVLSPGNVSRRPRHTRQPRRLNLAVACVLLAGLAACTTPAPPVVPTSFAEYQSRTLAELRATRAFQSADHDRELAWNGPREWRPAGPTRRGVLLVHGLGDSPWSFHDIGEQLAAQGFLVRTVLLDGHGSRPEHLLDVSLGDWQRVVATQVAALRADVDQVYLGGFSTGANLAVHRAYAGDDVDGLLLFSPAFRSDSAYDWLTPWIRWVRPWLLTPDGSRPVQNAVRYLTVPTNGFAQFYRSSRQVLQDLAQAPYDKPTLMVVAEHDSVIDTGALADTFHTRFTHPASRLIWYGNAPVQARHDPRILVRPDRLPDWRISQFSHMGVLFSPENALYGRAGSLRICWNGQALPPRDDCAADETLWFSDWGYQEPGKVHARLTFNPYFSWQGEVLAAQGTAH